MNGMRATLVVAISIVVGLAAAGWLFSRGMSQFRMADRFVTVKGLAEKDAKADLALWTIKLVSTSDSLAQAQAKVDSDLEKVSAFLESKGLSSEEISAGRVEVIDLLAQQYRGEGASQSRYIVKSSVGVRTDKVDLIDQISRATGELVRSGVVLEENFGDGGSDPRFLFTKLNDVKPEMIAEATASARRAAEQFAKDSDSRLGKIKRAYQGMFMILARDGDENVQESKYIDKKIRVVSTVDYYLVR